MYVVIFDPTARSRDTAHAQCAIWPFTQGNAGLA